MAVSLAVFKTLQRTLKLWDLLQRLRHISAAWEKFGLNEEKRGEVWNVKPTWNKQL